MTEVQIERNEGDRLAEEVGAELRTVLCLRDGEAFPFKAPPQQDANLGIIVDDKDVIVAHGSAPYSRPRWSRALCMFLRQRDEATQPRIGIIEYRRARSYRLVLQVPFGVLS